MSYTYIKDLSRFEDKEITLKGWLAQKRDSKGLVFATLRDGTGFVQVVVDINNVDERTFNYAKGLPQESSLAVTGVVKKHPRLAEYELSATTVEIISVSENYPITPKEHGIEFLMDNRHVWLRSKRQWAIMRVRNTIIFAIHKFFQEEGFIQMDSPIFTGNAVEGTSTLFETDFYGEPAYLSQSGQLYGEAMAMAHNKIYTFGPTFRAEKSKTRRHLSEFWMIEPEMAFHDIFDNMDLIERFLRSVVSEVLKVNKPELELIERDITILENIIKPFPRLTYDEAVKIIKGEENVNGKNAITSLEEELRSVKKRIAEIKLQIYILENEINPKPKQPTSPLDLTFLENPLLNPSEKKQQLTKGQIGFKQAQLDKFKQELDDLEEQERNIPQWLNSARTFEYGNDFGGSDETVLTRLFDVPIMVYNWPHEVKAFYLKRDPLDSRFARGVDTLAPEGYGEIVGGGERETDENLLVEKINEHGLPMQAFEWYLDLRRFGSVPHAGFGLGLERLVTWVCKLPHVRESIPFPRMYGRLLP